MARQLQRLTALQVSKLTKPGLYGDGGGLTLQITDTGAKSWLFRFMKAGKPFAMGLGPTHTVSLAEARQKALDARKLLLDGINPLTAKRQKKIADALADAKRMTFDQCAQAYILAHRAGWKNAKHAAQWESTLRTYASPVFGAVPVAEVETPLVVKCLSPIWLAKTETASRLRGRIESVLDWATTSNHRQGDNPARWRGHLEHLLSAPNRTKRVEHHPALPWREIGAFLVVLRQQGGVAARALEFTILTAARSGEARLAQWSEIDTETKLWTVPAERMKAGKEHRVPLSASAIGLLNTLPRVGDLVFPGVREGRPLSDMSLTAVLRRMQRTDITVHGFRSTFRDWCAESTNFPREVCEHALAHSLPDKVEAAYRRGDLLDKRVQLMQAWADYCAKPAAQATVTPIRGKRPPAKRVATAV